MYYITPGFMNAFWLRNPSSAWISSKLEDKKPLKNIVNLILSMVHDSEGLLQTKGITSSSIEGIVTFTNLYVQ
jgi:hypothetical protein